MSEHTNGVRDQIVSLIVSHMNIDAKRVTDDATLDSLGADSLDQVELVMQIEEHFDIEIADDAADRIRTVGGLIAYVSDLVANK